MRVGATRRRPSSVPPAAEWWRLLPRADHVAWLAFRQSLRLENEAPLFATLEAADAWARTLRNFYGCSHSAVLT